MKEILVIDTRLIAFETYHHKLPISATIDIVYENASRYCKNPKIVFVMDNKFGSKRRKELYKEYKAHRKNLIKTKAEKDKLDKFNKEYNKLKELLYYFGSVIDIDGYEADDIANIIVDRFKDTNKIYLLSSDSDWASNIINDNIYQIHLKRGLITKNNIVKIYSKEAELILPIQALIGVTKENIKGVYKLGETRILKLLKENNNDILKVINIVQEYIDNGKFGMKLPENFNTVTEMYNFNYDVLRRITLDDLSDYEKETLKIQFNNRKVSDKETIEIEFFTKMNLPFILNEKMCKFFKI